jgi:hypothetical protein
MPDRLTQTLGEADPGAQAELRRCLLGAAEGLANITGALGREL